MQLMFRKISGKSNSRDAVSPIDNAHPQLLQSAQTRRPGNLNSNAFREPPPAYSAAPPAQAAAGSQGHIQANTTAPAARLVPFSPLDVLSTAIENTHISQPDSPIADDAYSFLRTFDTIFVIDDSGSMAGGRWREAADAIATVAPICTSHDPDGIDIYFLNASDNPIHHGVQRASTVREIFESVRPGGGTPTGQRLRSILTPYLRRFEIDPEHTRPINIICVTDGDAHDDVESPLIEAAKKLDALDAPAWQVGIQFFQIGNDPEATELLKYLDDELANSAGGSIRDIVDTVPFRGRQGGTLTAEGVLKVVLGSVNRRLDRRRSQDLHKASQVAEVEA